VDAMNLHNVEFIKSAASPDGFISDSLPKIVFSGKSNVGKSSVINRLLNRKNAARVSASPGKTIHVNYFKIDSSLYFVDLPGYGYAKVAEHERARWGKLMESFFDYPDDITLGVMIVDLRHAPTADDVTMANWFKATGCSMVIVANKLDKVKKSEVDANLLRVRETLVLAEETPIIPFSAETGTNRGALLAAIERAV
jgi:GTP-binding protein